jgi:hypothetical protein
VAYVGDGRALADLGAVDVYRVGQRGVEADGEQAGHARIFARIGAVLLDLPA